jgi:hypothetical protein
MPNEPKVTGGPRGSFISEAKVKEAIQAGKAAEEEKPPSQEEDAPEEEEKDENIPEKVNSALGFIPYKTFKKVYKEVWEQVKSKQHLAQGYCLYTEEMAGGVEVTMRTFRTGEMKILRRLAPAANPDTDFQKYLDEDMEHRSFQIILGLVRFDGQDLPEIPLPTGDIGKWRKSDEVQARLRWVDDLPEEMTALLGSVLADVTIAYRYALRENLKNQYALP